MCVYVTISKKIICNRVSAEHQVQREMKANKVLQVHVVAEDLLVQRVQKDRQVLQVFLAIQVNQDYKARKVIKFCNDIILTVSNINILIYLR